VYPAILSELVVYILGTVLAVVGNHYSSLVRHFGWLVDTMITLQATPELE